MKITILGEPMAIQSMRITNKGHRYQPKKNLNYKAQIRSQLLQQLPKSFVPLRGPVIIKDLIYVFPPLKNFPKYKINMLKNGNTIYKKTKPDLLDNLSKGFFDACEGILFLNDSQIVECKGMKKVYGLKPRIEFEIEEVEIIKKKELKNQKENKKNENTI